MPNGVRAFLYKALRARDSGRRASAAPEPAPRWVYLLFGLGAGAGSLLFRYALVPLLGDNEPFLPLFPLILFATLVGGGWAGGACLIVGLIGAWYLFMGLPDTFQLAPHELAGLISALLAGGVIVLLCVALRRLIAETTAAAEHEHVVAREFAHRMRNTLTLVLAISRRTFIAGRPLEAARRDFEDRILALSAAHATLLDARGENASLQEIVSRTLAPFGYAAGDPRFVVGGPAVSLSPDAATALALALHELSTNATKYGALSTPGGRIELCWSLAGADRRDLRLSWRESGGPPVSQPERRGFGARMIESNLAQALGGTAMLDFAPEGVRAEIAARLD